ncbi:hypothetical protein TCAL_03112 [Tigriopus californicus]|uniref:Protein-tyrosine sulfotransferase n=1 Tax=Tigriopus californicus TaxID=6832 RepID=A0A553NQX3_TIGCA|nr:protein-tyrosine sulfotransferase 2-like [Tigriopus californicus]TRY67835.1 hypothetical protein TCAL_03112 [Tigriopus californicus]|eukprot:TCALIF_03112-PA protein Name:"Similar to Tango13 Protein-tyrosine sulfotransferase (Drosophila melanogaster)" AED:0.02 eAED:0.02 QI:578/1/1/1/0.66/0.75/4/870/402
MPSLSPPPFRKGSHSMSTFLSGPKAHLITMSMTRQTKRYVLLLATAISVLYILHYLQYGGSKSGDGSSSSGGVVQMSRRTAMIASDGTVHEYDRQSPLIFIGGVPRSGTTLMRAMLDAHPAVRCGEETRVVPRILQMRAHWMKSQKEATRLEEAGLGGDVLDSAISAFILEVVARHGEPSERLCNKDPFTLKSGTYLKKLFPNGKFLFMVRDGRASVHSIITRKVTITGFDLKSYRQCLTKWNAAISAMNDQCNELGPDGCLRVYYEQLVLHPREWMEKILKFLGLPWKEEVLHHEQQINKPNGISLSKVERSSDQVVKPVNIEALSKWVGHIPDDVVQDMAEIAPMLNKMGYDPNGNPPVYGRPDSEVAKNMEQIKQNEQYWDDKGDLVKKQSKKGVLQGR